MLVMTSINKGKAKNGIEMANSDWPDSCVRHESNVGLNSTCMI